MDITQLQYFKVIAETGSLTKAAETLHVSQPAMSAMLKKFEEELNVELFDRRLLVYCYKVYRCISGNPDKR